MLDLLADNPLMLLFTVIGTGYLLGSVNFSGLRLGVAAVLFTGILFGALDRRLALPENIYILGLVLFVYSIGLHSGPAFFASFQRRGLRFSLITAGLIAAAALLTGGIALLLGFSAPTAGGLFCGALTNTPALAAAVETTKGFSEQLPDLARVEMEQAPVVAYSLAYPFGVFGVILWIWLFRRWRRGGPAPLPEGEDGGPQPIRSATFRVSNPGVSGLTVAAALAPLRDPGFVLSRIRKEDRTEIVDGETVLSQGDFVVAVGDPAALERARLVFGELVPEHLVEGMDGITYRRIFVSNKEVVGKTLGELQLGRRLRATVTRLRRGEEDIVPSADTVLEMGDRIRVVTQRGNLEAVTRFFGDSVRSIAETDFLSLSLGIVLGVFLGMIPIPLPGGIHFRLGFAGGPLIVGLILGRLGRTGPVIWEMPYSANLVLRQVGLVFFLAAIGTRAGYGFLETIQAGGWMMLAAGAVVTTFITLAVLVVGEVWLRLPVSAALGVLSGVQTQPAVLAYAVQQTESELPNTWYATVYPAAMVAKILLAQVIVSAVLTR